MKEINWTIKGFHKLKMCDHFILKILCCKPLKTLSLHDLAKFLVYKYSKVYDNRCKDIHIWVCGNCSVLIIFLSRICDMYSWTGRRRLYDGFICTLHVVYNIDVFICTIHVVFITLDCIWWLHLYITCSLYNIQSIVHNGFICTLHVANTIDCTK